MTANTIRPGSLIQSHRTGAIFTVRKVMPEHIAVSSGRYEGAFGKELVMGGFDLIDNAAAAVLPGGLVRY
jgi:hypothetical protein